MKMGFISVTENSTLKQGTAGRTNMNNISKTFHKQAEGRGLKSGRGRNAVLKALESSEHHLTVDELFELTKKTSPKVGYTTVWRALKLLESLGIVLPHKFHDGQTRYEYMKKGTHHDHMICLKCGRVEEFVSPKIEEIQHRMAIKHKFQIESHKMELYGYCKACK
jgi:Fur family ferric uptake transcriptional regulator